MSRVAIVGVEGSGKTVLMAAFGEKYVAPDESGLFLEPKDQTTFGVVMRMTADMREGKWPAVTAAQSVTSLDWKLCRRNGDAVDYLCDISFLDFGGELYRLAFGDHTEEEREPYRDQIESLKSHIAGADALVVLLNLKDVINGRMNDPRTLEMLWVTKGIVDYARTRIPTDRILLVFSQYETFRAAVEAAGGLKGAYSKYLRHMRGPHPDLPLASVSAVDRTVLTSEGYEVPSPDFTSSGLDSLMDWIVADVERRRREEEESESKLYLEEEKVQQEQSELKRSENKKCNVITLEIQKVFAMWRKLHRGLKGVILGSVIVLIGCISAYTVYTVYNNDLRIKARAFYDRIENPTKEIGESLEGWAAWPHYAAEIEELTSTMGKGVAAYNSGYYRVAIKMFTEVLNGREVFLKRKQKLVSVQTIEKNVAAVKSKVKNTDAEKYAANEWRNALLKEDEAAKLFKSGEFDKSKDEYSAAIPIFEEAARITMMKYDKDRKAVAAFNKMKKSREDAVDVNANVYFAESWNKSAIEDYRAYASYKNQDFDQAVQIYSQMADAFSDLATRARATNTVMALSYFMKADWTNALIKARMANQNDTNIAYYMGLCYAKGYGVPIDIAKARKFCELTAKLGDSANADFLAPQIVGNENGFRHGDAYRRFLKGRSMLNIDGGAFQNATVRRVPAGSDLYKVVQECANNTILVLADGKYKCSKSYGIGVLCANIYIKAENSDGATILESVEFRLSSLRGRRTFFGIEGITLKGGEISISSEEGNINCVINGCRFIDGAHIWLDGQDYKDGQWITYTNNDYRLLVSQSVFSSAFAHSGFIYGASKNAKVYMSDCAMTATRDYINSPLVSVDEGKMIITHCDFSIASPKAVAISAGTNCVTFIDSVWYRGPLGAVGARIGNARMQKCLFEKCGTGVYIDENGVVESYGCLFPEDEMYKYSFTTPHKTFAGEGRHVECNEEFKLESDFFWKEYSLEVRRRKANDLRIMPKAAVPHRPSGRTMTQ